MTPIGLFRVSLKVVSLRVVVAIGVPEAVGVVVVIWVVAARAKNEKKERRTRADVGRSAGRSPL